MANKLDIRYKILDFKKNLNPYMENQIQRIRSLGERQAARQAKRWIPLGGTAVIFLLVATSLFIPKNQFEKARENVLKNPQDLEAHLILIEEFLKNNQLEEAKKEILITEQLNHSSLEQNRVLGASSWFEDLKKRWQENDPQELQKLVKEWEKIVAETPTYRDGYLYLAFYYYKLGNKEAALQNLQKALDLDPDFESARKLEEIIE